MKNGADISYKENIKSVMMNTLERVNKGTNNGRETKNGLEMAIEYLNNFENDILTEIELKHVIRLSTYRGTATDYRAIKTA